MIVEGIILIWDYFFADLSFTFSFQILKNKGISKNKICKELDIPRPNFNRYCKNSFQRIDANLICKLCYYLECNIEELVTYIPPQETK